MGCEAGAAEGRGCVTGFREDRLRVRARCRAGFRRGRARGRAWGRAGGLAHRGAAKAARGWAICGGCARMALRSAAERAKKAKRPPSHREEGRKRRGVSPRWRWFSSLRAWAAPASSARRSSARRPRTSRGCRLPRCRRPRRTCGCTSR